MCRKPVPEENKIEDLSEKCQKNNNIHISFSARKKNNNNKDTTNKNLILVTGSVKVLIVSITKFSILIGSPRVYLSRNWRAITWVSNLQLSNFNFLLLDTCHWTPTPFPRQLRAL